MAKNGNWKLIGVLLFALASSFLIGACGGGDSTDDKAGSSSEGMAKPRGQHSATLLPDGRLLVIGGRSVLSYTSAEIYDPNPSQDTDVSQWSAAGDMSMDRFDHITTVLPNGLVLVTGGDKETGKKRSQSTSARLSLQDAELYDPSTNSWSSAPNMINQHAAGHTATLLNNGEVLVAGGLSIGGEGQPRIGSSYAEIYDPTSGTWSSTGNMTKARSMHRAILLDDGNVMAIGRESSEIYDPSTGKWTAHGKLSTDHGGQFTATLLNDGKILVAGGGHSEWVEGVEVSPPTPIASVDLYDPGSGEWSPAGDMLYPTLGHTATLLPNGHVLVVGFLQSQTYDPGSDTWVDAGQMDVQRGSPMIGGPAGSFHTATLMPSGRVLITGGNQMELSKFGKETDREGIGTIEIYDPAAGWISQ